MNLNDRVISFVQDLGYDQLPIKVRHQAKRCFLDFLGALIAGTNTPAARLMTQFAEANFAGDGASILVGGRRVSPAGAALANGFSGNALDIDDGYRLAKGHPGACAIPPVLAAAEMAGSTGRETLAAMVIGYEVGIRAGLVRHAVYPTYHSSGSWGAVAGAAAAGRLLGLDADILRHALGAAEYHAPIAPMMKGIDRPSMGKDSIGWGCMVAVSSVLMARSGFTGVEPLFDDGPDPSWIEELGREFRMLGLYFKPYAACRWAQPAVAGALKMIAENDIRASDINRVVVHSFTEAARLPRRPPGNTEDAQYSLSFPVAAAILDGRVGPTQVLPPRLFDRDILSLAELVEVETRPEFDQAFPEQALADVAVYTKGGHHWNSGPTPAKWEPPEVPTDRELEEKFTWLVEPVLGPEQTQRLAGMIWRLDELETLRPLFDMCRPNPEAR